MPLSFRLAIAAALLLSGCAGQEYTPIPGQRVMKTRKKSCMVVCDGGQARLAVTSLGIRDGKARFVFTTVNRSGAPLVISRVSATDERGRPVRLYSARDMEERAVKKAGALTEAVERRVMTDYAGECLPPAVAERVDARVSSRLAMIGEQLHDNMRESGKIFEPTCLPPGGTYSAVLVSAVSRELFLRFTLGSDVQEAAFKISHPGHR